MLDDLRPAPPRLHARGDAGVLRADRRGEVQQHDRHGVARRRDPRRPQRARAAGDGRAAAAQGGAHELPRGRSRASSKRSTTRRSREMGTRKVPLSPRAVHRAGRLHGGRAEEVLPPQARRRSAAALRRHHQVRRSGEGRRRPRDRAALHVRPRPQPQGEGHDPLGLAPSTPSPPRCGCTTTCSRSRTPTSAPAGRRHVPRQHQSHVARSDQGREARTVAGGGQARRASSNSSAWATSTPIRSTRSRASPCSTARPRCATVGRKKRRRHRSLDREFRLRQSFLKASAGRVI